MAKKAHADNFKEQAERNIRFYIGDQYDGEPDRNKRVPRNFIASSVDALVPAVYSRDPQVLANPEVPDKGDKALNMLARGYARMFQSLINQTLHKIRFKKTMKRVVKDAVLTGRGYIKLGFDAQVGTKEGKKYEFEGGKKLPGVPLDQNLSDDFDHTESVWAERVSPFRVFYDPEATGLDDAAWCVIEVCLRIEKVRSNPIYKNGSKVKPSGAIAEDLASAVVAGFDSEKTDPEGLDADLQRVVLYEIWDKESRMVYVLADGNEDLDFLRESDWPFADLNGFPITELMPIPVTDSQWGECEVNRMINGQEEFNVIRSMQFRHASRAMGGWTLQDGAADKNDVQRFLNSDVMDVQVLRHPEGLKPLIPPNMPPDYFNYAKELKDDMSENSKVPSWRRAGDMQNVRTAAQVSQLSQGLDAVLNEKIDVVEDFAEETISKMAVIMAEKYSMIHVVPVVGMQGTQWRRFDPKANREKLDISISQYSTTPANPDMERQQYMQFLPLLAQARQAGVPVNLMVYLQRLAEKLAIHDWDEFLGPESLAGMTPGQEQMMAGPMAQIMGQGIPAPMGQGMPMGGQGG